MRQIVRTLMMTGALVSLAVPCFAARIVVEGSTTVLPIAQRAAEEYMDAHRDADISVRGGGSGVGIASLIEGTCDIANASRAIKDDELQKAASRGRAPKANVVAMDGIAVIVNNANSVTELSKKQLKDIFTGKITDWAQAGGSAGQIVAVSRDSASGTFEAFGELALDKAKVRKDALMQASNQAVASVVSKTPGAIGYVGLAYLNGVKALTIDGVDPSKETVLSKQYKLSRPLFMYTNGKPAGLAKDYLDFIQSPAGQKLVEEEGYVSIR
ncbi:MAG: phosphate ABC transporter substrate-binding protein [Candidatus Omnitrophica bacterium]|nr:phosphate ABC transporter substrate-binding protein [Candidatus Omnitrophota bacterium]MDD5774988.1 phosphate ABC transporter substrate-binding protein [Candidatus Omnitrophota bacterium]